MVPETHPLLRLFVELVGRHYAQEIGIRDPQVVDYVAHMLAEFCDVKELFRIKNVNGRPLSDVGEMLLESDPCTGRRHPSNGSARPPAHWGLHAVLHGHVSGKHQPLAPAAATRRRASWTG